MKNTVKKNSLHTNEVGLVINVLFMLCAQQMIQDDIKNQYT